MISRIVFGEDQRVGPWVCERTGGAWICGDANTVSVEVNTIGLERHGELVAGVIYDHYNKASIWMHVASDGSRRWLTQPYLRACFLYPFEQLKVRKVIGVVPSANADALEFDKKLGFVQEGRITDAHPDGDIIVLTMTRKQCRWI